MLNLQDYTGMAYQAEDAKKDIEKLEKEWYGNKRSIFAPDAKMVRASHAAHLTIEDEKFNHDLSTVKSLKTIAAFNPQLSFRVSPKGSTPTLVDSNNISNLGFGADYYLKVMPGLKVWYIHWVPGSGPQMVLRDNSDPPLWHSPDIPYPFRSKSGGDILNQVLFSRKVAFEVFQEHDLLTQTCIIVPRMSSVLVVTDEDGAGIKAAFYRLRTQCPMVEITEGARQESQWPSSS